LRRPDSIQKILSGDFVMQSMSSPQLHLAVIMDGNGRWAAARGMPRSAGHRAGVEAARRIVQAAMREGVGTLTLFAFAAANWRRPRTEVAALFGLLVRFLHAETDRLHEAGVRLTVIGRRDRLPAGLADGIARAEAMTAGNRGLHLRIALDFSGRAAILDAARRADAATTPACFAMLVAPDGAPDVDLVIRTGGEQRLSDFLLWEAAHAELFFSPLPWPDFDAAALQDALAWFAARERRFGGLGPASAPPAIAEAVA